MVTYMLLSGAGAKAAATSPVDEPRRRRGNKDTALLVHCSVELVRPSIIIRKLEDQTVISFQLGLAA